MSIFARKQLSMPLCRGELLNLLPMEKLSQAKKHMKKAKKADASRWLSFHKSVAAMAQ